MRIASVFVIFITLGMMCKAQTNENIPSVKIGEQVWMTKNLDVNTFANGDLIPEAKTNEEWLKASDEKKPAWCYYDNDPSNGAKYGKLYNWFALADSRGLAPKRWHIPSDDEWTSLINYLGGELIAGLALKNKSGWKNTKDGKIGNGNNKSGFEGLPGGNRFMDGTFFPTIGNTGIWWCTTEKLPTNAWYRWAESISNGVARFPGPKGDGYSVRCVKD